MNEKDARLHSLSYIMQIFNIHKQSEFTKKNRLDIQFHIE